jgi:hypothetical protein
LAEFNRCNWWEFDALHGHHAISVHPWGGRNNFPRICPFLHHIFGKIKDKSLNGTNVAWDYTSLDLFARDYRNREKIPDELFEKMVAAQNHLSGMGMMVLLCYGKLDLELHHNHFLRVV